MRMNRKGAMAISTVVAAIMAFGAVATVGGAIVSGGLADALQEGADLLSDSQDWTVEVDSKEKLSNLSMFVYHRASNDGCRGMADDGTCKAADELLNDVRPTVCHQNQGLQGDIPEGTGEEGYPALEDTYIGSKPSCQTASSTVSRGLDEATFRESGYDMEGVYSREYFEITKEGGITLNTDPEQAEVWLEHHSLLATQNSFDEAINKRCGQDSDKRHFSSEAQFSYYFNADVGDSRVNPWMREDDALPEDLDIFCALTPSLTDNLPGPTSTILNAVDINDDLNIAPIRRRSDSILLSNVVGVQPVKSKITLCKGDKGYIQVNKGTPMNDGEADEEQGNNPVAAPKFAYIQINELGTSGDCRLQDNSIELEEINLREGNRLVRQDHLMIEGSIENNRLNTHDVRLTIDDDSGQLNQKTFQVDGDSNSQFSIGSTKNIFEMSCDITLTVEAKLSRSGSSWEEVNTYERNINSVKDGCPGSGFNADIESADTGVGSSFFGFGDDRLESDVQVYVAQAPSPDLYQLELRDEEDEVRREKRKELEPGQTKTFELRGPQMDQIGCQVSFNLTRVVEVNRRAGPGPDPEDEYEQMDTLDVDLSDENLANYC